jgi:septum site-determining protein MinD
MKKPVLGVIVTRVKRNEFEMQPDTVKEMLEVPILGMVPEDIIVQEALSMKDAVVHTHPKSDVSRAYKEIAAKILDVEYNSKKDREKLLEKLFKRFRKKK